MVIPVLEQSIYSKLLLSVNFIDVKFLLSLQITICNSVNPVRSNSPSKSVTTSSKCPSSLYIANSKAVNLLGLSLFQTVNPVQESTLSISYFSNKVLLEFIIFLTISTSLSSYPSLFSSDAYVTTGNKSIIKATHIIKLNFIILFFICTLLIQNT